MKVTLEFNLPEDQEEFDIHRQAMDFFVVLSDLDQELRAMIKYGEISDEKREAYEIVRTMLLEYCEDRSVKI